MPMQRRRARSPSRSRSRSRSSDRYRRRSRSPLEWRRNRDRVDSEDHSGQWQRNAYSSTHSRATRTDRSERYNRTSQVRDSYSDKYEQSGQARDYRDNYERPKKGRDYHDSCERSNKGRDYHDIYERSNQGRDYHENHDRHDQGRDHSNRRNYRDDRDREEYHDDDANQEPSDKNQEQSSYLRRDRLAVRGIPPDVDEDTVRYTFAPHAPVGFVDMVADPKRPGFHLAFVRFPCHRDAAQTLEAVTSQSTPLEIGSEKVEVDWADGEEFRKLVTIYRKGKRDTSEQFNRGASQGQAQTTANVMGDFVWQPSSSYYYSASRRMYYDPKSQMYYSIDSGCYVRYDATTGAYVQVEAAGSSSGDAGQVTTSLPNDALSTQQLQERMQVEQQKLQQQLLLQQQQQQQQEAEAARKAQRDAEAAVKQALNASLPQTFSPDSKPSDTDADHVASKQSSVQGDGGSVKFAFSATSKRINKDMQRWKQKHEELESEVQTVRKKSEAAKCEGRPKNLSSANAAAFELKSDAELKLAAQIISATPETAEASASKTEPTPRKAEHQLVGKHGVRPRVYVSVEKKVCLLCQRQFKDESKLEKHELHSELHKTNLRLDEYEKVRRVEASAKALGIELAIKGPKRNRKPKKRPFVSIHDEAKDVSTAEVKPKDEPFGGNSVGNKLLKAMGWKQGQGLGKNGTGITTPVTAQIHTERAGLGSQPAGEFAIEAGDDRKMIAYKLARSRFDQSRSAAFTPDPTATTTSSE